MPYQLNDTDITPVYDNFEGWDKPIASCETMDDLPEAFRKYLRYITDYLGISITYISNGPGREQIIHEQATAEA
jgi:adenylosuccinate synthase